MMSGWTEHPPCCDPGCPLHGIAASNRRQSEFYAANDRTIPAGPDEDEDEVDPCATCGRENVIDGPDPAAHWSTPHSDVIAAWSCSAPCSDALEATRRPDGTLPERTAP